MPKSPNGAFIVFKVIIRDIHTHRVLRERRNISIIDVLPLTRMSESARYDRPNSTIFAAYFYPC